MKNVMILAVILGLSGCGVELLTTAAIQGELAAQNATAIKRQVGGATENLGRTRIERAIETFYAENWRYPASLDELVPTQMASVPVKSDGTAYGYDPKTGKIFDDVGSAARSADDQNMTQLRAAIDAHGKATGYYPPSLDALVPRYIAAIPSSSSGQAFVYSPQNGQLGNPASHGGSQTRQARGATAAGGATGPMGEVMTGIAVQNELNRMGNSGANSAGSYARRGIGNKTQGHSDRQLKALDDLGL